MYKRLNITLPEDVLSHADAFAKAERYTRSGLIARALEEFIGDAAIAVPQDAGLAEETGIAYGQTTGWVGTRIQAEGVAALARAFFAARDDVEAAWLFGSAVRDEARPYSDIDIAVLPATGVHDGARWELQLDLVARLPSALGVERVDVVVVPAASPVLMQRALVEGRRIWGEGSRRAAEAEIRAANEYRDSAALRRTLDRRLTERVDRHARRR